MRRELSRPEITPIVRHLLTGCPPCLQRTRPLWKLGARELTGPASGLKGQR
jgi:hypothetical protein